MPCGPPEQTKPLLPWTHPSPGHTLTWVAHPLAHAIYTPTSRVPRPVRWQCLHWQSVSITGMTGAGSQINEPAAFVFAIDLTSGIRFWGESRSVYLRPD